MIALLAMPEDPTAIPAWLDRQLLSPDLPGLVEELRIVHRPGRKPDLGDVLGQHRQAFLDGGFSALPRAVRSQLLRNPDLLPEVSELVFAEGGDFWFADPFDSDMEARKTAVAHHVHRAMFTELRRPPRTWWRYAAVSLAAAAAVLLPVMLFNGDAPTPKPTGWGFAKVAQLPRNANSKTVYTELAQLADEWNKKPTPDRHALARRLTEFRLGCSDLIAADLPLSESETDWVKDRCREWAALIDAHLRDLDATGDVGRVRADSTATASNIARELRTRAS